LINQLLLFSIVFVSAFTQSVTGFGVALVGMPLLAWLLGVQVAAPLVALYGIVLNLAILWRYRIGFKSYAVSRLVISSVVGIPLGIWALEQLNEVIILKFLGLILISYSLYILVSPRLFKISQSHLWTYGFGFVAGCLGGAYNAFGPPVIIYGQLKDWTHNEFKSNLQAFFLFNAAAVVFVHGMSGNLTDLVWRSFLVAIPACALGIIAGLSLDRFINQKSFGKLVVILLLGLGISLVGPV
jgi:uncharacterized membrane protein YfcA